jgi:hypothetical protein
VIVAHLTYVLALILYLQLVSGLLDVRRPGICLEVSPDLGTRAPLLDPATFLRHVISRKSHQDHHQRVQPRAIADQDLSIDYKTVPATLWRGRGDGEYA